MGLRDPRPVLYAKWSRREKAVVYGGTCRPDGRVLAHLIEGTQLLDGKTLLQLLEERGYDVSTLRLMVRRNHAPHTGDAAVDAAATLAIDTWRLARKDRG